MRIIHDSFAGNHDLQEMELLAYECRTENLHVTDLPYRLCSWALRDPDNVHLLRDKNKRLLAWMVMQTPFDSLDFCCLPELESTLLPELLNWADARSIEYPGMIPLGTPEDKPCWFINVFANQSERIKIIENAGFTCQANVDENSWSKLFLRRPGNLPIRDYPIPKGFEIRPLAGESEAMDYVRLHRETFNSQIMSYEWRIQTLHHPAHIPELDLVISAPDGRLVAFCVCWLDQHGPNPGGQIEPLGCHPDFRHFALGRAALAEGIRRLQSFGAYEIHVETDNWRNTALRLYESLGFQVEKDVLVYRKDY